MPTKLATLSDDEVTTRLRSDLPGWSLVEGQIERTYRTPGWPTTLMLVNAIGYIAEAADHHPDLAVGWDSVRVRLRTHHADGISRKDLELAKKVEESALWRPGEDSALAGSPRPLARGSEDAQPS